MVNLEHGDKVLDIENESKGDTVFYLLVIIHEIVYIIYMCISCFITSTIPVFPCNSFTLYLKRSFCEFISLSEYSYNNSSVLFLITSGIL